MYIFETAVHDEKEGKYVEHGKFAVENVEVAVFMICRCFMKSFL